MKNKEMVEKKYGFSNRSVSVYFDASFAMLQDLVDKENTILITDENIFANQSGKVFRLEDDRYTSG